MKLYFYETRENRKMELSELRQQSLASFYPSSKAKSSLAIGTVLLIVASLVLGYFALTTKPTSSDDEIWFWLGVVFIIGMNVYGLVYLYFLALVMLQKYGLHILNDSLVLQVGSHYKHIPWNKVKMFGTIQKMGRRRRILNRLTLFLEEEIAWKGSNPLDYLLITLVFGNSNDMINLDRFHEMENDDMTYINIQQFSQMYPLGQELAKHAPQLLKGLNT